MTSIQMGAGQLHHFCKRGNCVRATPHPYQTHDKNFIGLPSTKVLNSICRGLSARADPPTSHIERAEALKI